MPKLQLWVCDSFRPDVEAALRAEGIEDVEVAVFPARCGHPAMHWQSVTRPFRGGGGDPRNACLMGGVCLAGFLSQAPGELAGCRTLHKNVCFEYLLGSQTVDWLLRSGAYLLTPGWLEHWPRRMEELGFSRETGRLFFRETAQKLVLLDTGTLPDSAEKLKQLAGFLDLPAETFPTGLDLLRLELRVVVERWRREQETRRLTESCNRARRLASDFAMASEMLGEVAEIAEEELVVRKILDICRSLFAASQLKCVSLSRGAVSHAETHPRSAALPSDFVAAVEKEAGDFGFSRSGTGFWLKLIFRQETIGWLDADGFAFPEQKSHYLNLALAMGRVFALCIRNARAYARIEETVGELQHEVNERQQLTRERESLITQLQENLAKIKTLQGLLPICAGCKKIRDADGNWNPVEVYVQARTDARFSHGMCPDCIPKWFPGVKHEKSTDSGG